MTLDATKPTDQVLISEIPGYIRENRTSINSIESGESEYTTTELNLATGTTTLVIGTNISNTDIETILISALGACVLENITGGTAGQIKRFIMQDNNISFKDGLKESGKFYLNQLPALTDFDASIDDSISLVNIDGDGLSNNGYWKEITRQISIK